MPELNEVSRLSTPRGPKDSLDLARSPQATSEQLRALGSSPYSFVLEAVAGHPATPVEILAQLVPAELRTARDATRLIALIRNPRTPGSALRTVPALILPRLSVRDDHYGFEAGVALSERPDTQPQLLIDLLSDPRASTHFRKVIARQTTHTEVRRHLQSDRSERVRRAADYASPVPPAPGRHGPTLRVTAGPSDSA
jgi:hypothetical protein